MIEANEKPAPGKSKAEMFAEDPDSFVRISDALLIILKKDDGEGKESFAVLNNCTTIRDVFAVKGHAEEACDLRRDQIRYQQMQRKASTGLIIPSNNQHMRTPVTRGAFGGNGKHGA